MAVESFINAADMETDLRIPDSQPGMDNAFREQAGFYAHYATLHMSAARQAGDKSLKVDITRAQLDQSIRADYAAAEAAGDKLPKLTEAAIEARIVTDSRFVLAKKEKIDAEAFLDLARGALEAFKQRRDMLIQLGCNAREEMKGELAVRGAPITASEAARRVTKAMQDA